MSSWVANFPSRSPRWITGYTPIWLASEHISLAPEPLSLLLPVAGESGGNPNSDPAVKKEVRGLYKEILKFMLLFILKFVIGDIDLLLMFMFILMFISIFDNSIWCWCWFMMGRCKKYITRQRGRGSEKLSFCNDKRGGMKLLITIAIVKKNCINASHIYRT